MKVTKDTVTISELQHWVLGGRWTVQLKDADPNELQLFIEKMPASIKGKTKSMKCIDFGFGTKRHMVEPLAVCGVVYRYRQIKLMTRVQ